MATQKGMWDAPEAEAAQQAQYSSAEQCRAEQSSTPHAPRHARLVPNVTFMHITYYIEAAMIIINDDYMIIIITLITN